MNKETLEEVAQRLYPINIVVDYDTNEDIRNIYPITKQTRLI